MEKGTDRPRRGRFAQQPERSSRSPLSRSLGQPCNFRPLPISSTDILRDYESLIEPFVLCTLACGSYRSIRIIYFLLHMCISFYKFPFNICPYILVRSRNFLFSSYIFLRIFVHILPFLFSTVSHPEIFINSSAHSVLKIH